MRVGIDCRTIGSEPAGVGKYTLFLVQEILRQNCGDEYVLFFERSIPDERARAIVGEYPKVKIVKLPARTIPFVSAHVAAARAVAKEKLDVFHAPDGHVPYFYSGPTVITIHDFAILQHPEWFPESAGERFFSTRILLPRAIFRAQRIIVPSENTARDLKYFYGVGSDRVRVIPLAPALPPESRPPPNAPSGPYLLFVGTLEPRKNLLRLLRSFAALHLNKGGPGGVKLLLAGQRGWKDGGIMEAIKKTEQVEYLGYVAEEEKRWLMEHAVALVFPSLYEGFGLPVLEAMSVGTPVITSRVGSRLEIADDVAFLVDPEDEEGLREALDRIISDETWRATLATRGRAAAAAFLWPKTAEQTLKIYQKAAGG